MPEWELIRQFEREIAAFAGAKYGVAVESCSAALFLCCKYLKVRWVHIPKRTYPSVPCSIINAGGRVYFTDEVWSGAYQLRPYPIYDSAKRFMPMMYAQDSFYCLSFHTKKRIPIGRGGMILCNDGKAVDWFKKARFDGRCECPLHKDNFTTIGWNMYMTPEQAARGLELFHACNNFEDLIEEPDYPDLSKFLVYKYGDAKTNIG